jgi:hypothetical protein
LYYFGSNTCCNDHQNIMFVTGSNLNV